MNIVIFTFIFRDLVINTIIFRGDEKVFSTLVQVFHNCDNGCLENNQMWGCLKRAMQMKEERHLVQINKEKTPITAFGNKTLSNEEELHYALLEQSLKHELGESIQWLEFITIKGNG